MFSRIHSKKLCDGMKNLCMERGIVIFEDDVRFPVTCSLVLESYYDNVHRLDVAAKIRSIWFPLEPKIVKKVGKVLKDSGYPLTGKISIREWVKNRQELVI